MTRSLLVCFALVALVGITSAQAPPAQPKPDPKNLKFRGDRFKPLTWDEMTPAQRKMVEDLVAGPRSGADGPFNVLLRSPEMGNIAQQFGAATRFNPTMPRKLNELAIIITGRHWTAQYEWIAHKRAALAAGLNPAIVDAIQNGRRPAAMEKDEEAVYTFCTELLNTKQVSDATFAAAKASVGEKGVVDLIGVMGWYQTVSMLLNVDRYPLPAGQQPELKPIS
jgi:4-carboxymuconolactone decarboxylase